MEKNKSILKTIKYFYDIQTFYQLNNIDEKHLMPLGKNWEDIKFD